VKKDVHADYSQASLATKGCAEISSAAEVDIRDSLVYRHAFESTDEQASGACEPVED
jgi:hypothetical protein